VKVNVSFLEKVPPKKLERRFSFNGNIFTLFNLGMGVKVLGAESEKLKAQS
jgi:hypothetical protein